MAPARRPRPSLTSAGHWKCVAGIVLILRLPRFLLVPLRGLPAQRTEPLSSRSTRTRVLGRLRACRLVSTSGCVDGGTSAGGRTCALRHSAECPVRNCARYHGERSLASPRGPRPGGGTCRGRNPDRPAPRPAVAGAGNVCPAPAARPATGLCPVLAPLLTRRWGSRRRPPGRKSRALALRNSAKRTSCSRDHTPASVHSARGRQQVMPDPKPSSCGRCSQEIPVGSSASPSMRWRTRRTVAPAGATGPRPGSRHGPPSRARTLGGASAAHSAIVARDFAPARTAHAARERTKACGWRRPWSRRGSGT